MPANLRSAFPIEATIAVGVVIVAVSVFPIVAKAQNPMDPYNVGPPMPCMINPSLCGYGGSSSTSSSSSGSYDSGAFRRNHPDVDTAENRQLSNRIYEVAFGEVNKALATKGKAAALQLLQHQEKIQGLTDLVEGVSDEKYILTQRAIAAYITDARLYINSGQILRIRQMSDASWKKLVAKAQEDVDSKASNTSQFQFLKNCTESPNCYGPTDLKAAQLVITVSEEKQEKIRIANEKAEAVRREEEKIAATKAAEEAERARIAKEKADEDAIQAKLNADIEEARIYKEKHVVAAAAVTNYLGMGPVPPCNKPYEVTFALEGTQGHSAIEVYTTRPTIIINAFGPWRPTFDTKGLKKNEDYFLLGPNDGPFYIDVDLPQTLQGNKTDKKAVLVFSDNGIHAGSRNYSLWGWIAIDSIRFCK